MYHVDWSLWIKIPVSDRLVCERFCAELWVNVLDGCWKRIFNLHLDLSKRPLDYSLERKQRNHSMRCMFEGDRTDAVIFVDARNAFNSLNRQAALHSIRVICPQMTTILVNTYRRPAGLIILGDSDIYSLEGTTQGHNLAMAFYALGTTPHVNPLQIIYGVV